MDYLREFNEFDEESVLIIVDVQKSFKKFFTKNFVKALKKYCRKFDNVYQIYDNHVEGKNPDKDYLYDEDPAYPDSDDMFDFPNQVDLIEKRYRYDVKIDFFKSELEPEQLEEIRKRENNGEIEIGEYFKTKNGTILVFIKNNHNWFECPVKLFNLFNKFKGKEITMVGGADRECFTDVEITAKSLGVNVKRNNKYIWSADNCPIK